VRAAEVAVTKSLENVDTMDTKGLPTDGVHYKAAGQITIGRLCAQRWLDMHFEYGVKVPVVNRHFKRYIPESGWISSHNTRQVFDLSGRAAGVFSINNGTCAGSSLLPTPGSYVVKMDGRKRTVVNIIR
jgi:hypothetical protein